MDTYGGVGDAFGVPGGYEVPDYTVFDALARFDLGRVSRTFDRLTVQVNATTILDKRYLTSCYLDFGTGWCWYGNRRTMQGTIAYRF